MTDPAGPQNAVVLRTNLHDGGELDTIRIGDASAGLGNIETPATRLRNSSATIPPGEVGDGLEGLPRADSAFGHQAPELRE